MDKRLYILGSVIFILAALILWQPFSNNIESAASPTQDVVAETPDTQKVVHRTNLSSPIVVDIPEGAQKVFNAETFTLDNGLLGVVIPNNRAPIVMHMVWYFAGAADEKPGKSGIAHFMEHLMFKGSTTSDGRTLAPGEFSKIVRGFGGQDNAFTGQDYTAYFQSASKDKLETLMQMEAGRMMGFMPPEEEVNSERLVILEERSQRTDNTVDGQFDENMMAGLYVNHPYGTPIIGWRHEMETLSRQDALDFHDQFYAPNNAVLVVTGDITVKEVKALAEETYGTVAPRNVTERKRTLLPTLDGVPTYTHRHERVFEPSLQRIYAAPSARTNLEASLALQVLQDILGNGSTSRLYKSLVVDQKLASNTALFYRADGWSGASLYIVANPLSGVDLETLDKAIEVEIDKIVAHGVTQEELKDSITRMQDQAIFARDSLRGPAMIVGAALASGAPLDYVEYWPALIAKISVGDIQAAAQSYLHTDGEHTRFVKGYLHPKDGDTQ